MDTASDEHMHQGSKEEAQSQSLSKASAKGRSADAPSAHALGSLQIWASRWGALDFLAERLASVTHPQRIMACLAASILKELSRPSKVSAWRNYS